MFLLLYDRHVCAPQKGTNMASLQSSINLGDTLLQITREWKTAETWFLERLLIYQSYAVSQVLDFIHWMVTVFSFDHMTGENREYTVGQYIDDAVPRPFFWEHKTAAHRSRRLGQD